jgi:succinate dehydrogenase / fumarate reductase cytochrome b subunit
MTGVLLTAGLLLFVVSLAMIQCGASSFNTMQAFIQLPLVELALWLMIYALFFHLCHGVRNPAVNNTPVIRWVTEIIAVKGNR